MGELEALDYDMDLMSMNDCKKKLKEQEDAYKTLLSTEIQQNVQKMRQIEELNKSHAEKTATLLERFRKHLKTVEKNVKEKASKLLREQFDKNNALYKEVLAENRQMRAENDRIRAQNNKMREHIKDLRKRLGAAVVLDNMGRKRPRTNLTNLRGLGAKLGQPKVW